MKMLLRIVLMLLFLGAVLGGIFGWKQQQAKQMAVTQSRPPPPASVTVTTVHAETLRPRLEALGSLVASQSVAVSTEVAGIVSAIHFKSGQTVELGTQLVELDSRVEQADLLGLLAQQRLAELDFKRSESLLKNSSVSHADYDTNRARLEQMQAQVAAKRAAITYKQINAPFAGVLGIRQVDPGQYLAPGAPIVSLRTLDPLFVDFTLPEREFAQVRIGQEFTLRVAAYASQVFSGRISVIEPGLDSATRSLRLRGELVNRERLLRPGMFAPVSLALPHRREVLTLPRHAVTYNPYGETVFVVVNGEAGALSVQRRQIRSGEVYGDRVEIVEGLKVGEQVISAGQVKLRPGQAIVVDTEAGAALDGTATTGAPKP